MRDWSSELPRWWAICERRATLMVAATLGALSVAQPARALVVEPNGVQVPNISGTNGEVTLQAYFDSENEGIDSQSQASAEPGVFSPQCDFSAKLVLRGSGSKPSLSWYNAPADPNQKPDPLYPLVPGDAAIGAVFTAADIRSSPNYAGGLIGFALVDANDAQPIYYSEYERNADCTGCTDPGYWKMMLAYRSNLHQSAYYIAFEDWPGADSMTWYGNDGDFNDQVFLVTGVSCPGGGEPCDTGALGLCAAGLTECSFSGAPVCKPQYKSMPESCDNVDNDCDGVVDNGAGLCPKDQVCYHGQCVGPCDTGEFRCPGSLVCGPGGYCIDPACANVSCDAGFACRNGRCVGACQDVVCPLGQVCQLDRCVDPCAGVTCATGTFCQQGVCVGDCTCSGCPTGQECARDGRCVAPGCGDVTCSAGQGCRDGACVDACSGASCPGGAVCNNGQCAEPPPAASGGTTANAAGGFTLTFQGGLPSIGQGGAASLGGSAAASGGANSGAMNGTGNHASGCGCRVSSSTAGHGSWLALLVAGALSYRRTRSARRTSRARSRARARAARA